MEDLLTVTPKSAISHGWRGVLLGRDIVMNNAGWEIGNGESTNIWDKPWLSVSEQDRPMGPAPREFQNFTVSDLMIPESREWNIDLIRLILPDAEQKIRAIKPSVSGAPDKLSWLGSASGSYTTKSGYATVLSKRLDLMEIAPEDLSYEWRKMIWNLKTSPKTKLFAWKMLHGAIPAGEELRHRHINVDGKCKRCNQPETIDHLFFHCAFAKQIWSSAPVFPSVEYNESIDLRSLWNCVVSRRNLPPTGIAEGQLAPWIVWSIWTARNNLLFNDKPLSPLETLTKAISLAREWRNCQAKLPIVKVGNLNQITLPPQCVVIRTDAAWNEQHRLAGLGWTEENQNRVSSSSRVEHFVASPLTAEALALREALRSCKDKGLARVKCESDCAVLIKAVNTKTCLAGFYVILSDVQILASSFDFISFEWIPRLKNAAADCLAKQCLAVELTLMAAPNSV